MGIHLGNWRHISILLFLFLTSISSYSEGKQKIRGAINSRQLENSKKQINSSFVQIPHSNPPTVRPPPYTISKEKCPEINLAENWVDTLCGDLNARGQIPQNPFGHKFPNGGTYPFDIIKNKTLEFFRHALPILKNTKSLPKVARYSSADFHPPPDNMNRRHRDRVKRGIATRQPAYGAYSSLDSFQFSDDIYHSEIPEISQRKRRQYGPGPIQNNHNRFCENTMNYYNRLCRLYNAMWAINPHKSPQRETSVENRYYHPNAQTQFKAPHSRLLGRPSIDVTVIENSKSPKSLNTMKTSSSNKQTNVNQIDMPPTPCPSSAEYMTPVFARNHEGAWRYVVQIPKEGYFTQTVEVTKCLKSSCFYMEGSCKTSPRWQSLLVAELYYPDAHFPTMTSKQKRRKDFDTSSSLESSLKSGNKGNAFDPSTCDGQDDIGCFQVRLFYDWFLIPGSCKCWKTQFDFTQRKTYK